MPDRPETVPADAWWSARDREWVLGDKDADGKLHGPVTYWRQDGTLVNRCIVEDGYPHGPYTRYHESGEVSREGTLVRGRPHGTDVFIRSDSPTSEQFPRGLHANVWRAEMDMVNGATVGGRLFDREGRRVGEDGVPVPERPPTVPEEAVYSTTSRRWVLGQTVDDERDGQWTFYAPDGWIQQVVVYREGVVDSDVVYANAFVSMASVALGHGDLDASGSVVSAGLDELSDGVDRLALLELGVRILVARGQQREAAQAARDALAAHPVSSSWGRFTKYGQRGLRATAALEAEVARDHLASGRGAEALAQIRQAIVHAPEPSAPLYVVKAEALAMLGREDQRLSALKTALAIDEELECLASVKADPVFADWIAALDPESMTLEGAWEVLGEGGEKLEQYQGVVVDEDDDEPEPLPPRVVFDPDTMAGCVDHPWDLEALPTCSAELVRFAALAPGLDSCRYRETYVRAGESTVSSAVQTMDGNWLGRIQSIFLPGSMVSVGQESLMLAAWMPTAQQTSHVYSIHQDDRTFEHFSGSLSAMVVQALELDDDDEELSILEKTRNRWSAAADLTAEHTVLDEPFELLQLEERTHWIVNLLIGKHPDVISQIHLGQGIQTAATRDDWAREKDLLAWPHLAAYWLMHHAVFGDHEALAEVLEHAERRYPGAAELADVATCLLAGEAVEAAFWNEDRVLEVRMEALEKRPDLLTEDAQVALKRDHQAIFAAAADVEAALDVLAADEANENLVGFLRFLNAAGGKLEAYQEALARQDERDIDFIMAMKNGRVTSFEQVFRNMGVLPARIAELPSRRQPVHELFEAAVVRGSGSPDDHANTMPGGLYGLGLLTVTDAASFDAYLQRVQAMPFYPEKFGAYRRLQMAMLAEPYRETSAMALAFLRAEAARYDAQFDAWGSDTFDFADRILTEARDDRQLRALDQRLREGSFSGANWKASVRLCREFLDDPSPLLAPGLSAAVEKGLGRHDDGDRAVVVRAYARCAGEEARERIDTWLANIRDVRGDCEKAALLAGRLEVDVGTPHVDRTCAEAREVLKTLGEGSMQVGAALSLLFAVHAHQLPGFGDAAAKFAELAANESYGSDELRDWIAAASTSFPQ